MGDGGQHEHAGSRPSCATSRSAWRGRRGKCSPSRAGRVEVAATKSSPTDVVTEMDRRAEALIRSRILAARPDDAILGEEEGQTGDTAGAPARWVVDPLDGTVNYLYGLPDWAVSIAAEVGGGRGGRRWRGGRQKNRGRRGVRPGSRRDVQRVRRRRRVARGRGRRACPAALRPRRAAAAGARRHRVRVPGGAGGRSRARSSPRCCPGCGTSGGSAWPPSTCARSRRDGLTASTSGG